MARAPEGTLGVKLSTPRRGCSGLAYSVDYVAEANPFDERIDTAAGPFFIDGASILYLIGIDDGLARGRFRRRLRLRKPQRQGPVRLRRELHRLSRSAARGETGLGEAPARRGGERRAIG